MACNAQHRLAELGGNLEMCQSETRHSVSNTSCSAKVNDSSMRWRVVRVLGRGME